jgi:AcrR family transcriptional regulator
MSRKQENTKESIIAASLDLIEKDGYDSFSMRNVANHMKISTQPLYSYFKDSTSLYKAVLAETENRIVKHTNYPYTEHAFRNMGFGFVLFAKHHPNLFNAFFATKEVNEPFQDEFLQKLRYSLDNDKRFDSLNSVNKTRLIQKMWIFTFGYSKLITKGLIVETTDESIKEMILETGTSIILDTFNKIK